MESIIDKSLPRDLYSVAQTRELDRITIQQYGIAGIELMRRAGYALFDRLLQYWPETTDVTVFCGAGNNAGDGYIVARLALAAGMVARLFTLVDPEYLKGDAKTAFKDFVAAGGQVLSFDSPNIPEQTIIVDALVGTGLDRPLSGNFLAAVEQINRSSCPVIAVDTPSGIHGDKGIVMGAAVKADVTVSFIGLKQGLLTGDATEYCGRLVFSSLNVPVEVYQAIKPSAQLLRPNALPKRARNSHKGANGHVLLVGGDCGYSGAIRLAAEAALRAGAGLVSVATRAKHSHLLNVGRFEIMSHAVEDEKTLQGLLDKSTVVVIGPGLGQSPWAEMMFCQILRSELPLVMDADGLNLLAKNPAYRNNWVLTPHPGEAARLLTLSSEQINQNRFAAVDQLFQKFGGVTLLKGAGTLIKSETRLSVNLTGNPGMASGGMGDVLAGFIGSLIAQGLSLDEATEKAVFWHGQAADQAVAIAGERGLLASDLFPFIRTLVN
jgi:NAD(P)H-hydrate epimerase